MRSVVLLQTRTEFQSEVMGKPFLPLSLLTAATNLTEDHRVVLIDQRVHADWRSRLEAALEDRPVCVGLTAMTGKQIRHAVDATRLVKRHSDVPVVWGGPHAAVVPEQTLADRDIDVVVPGEGEYVFRDLVHALDAGTSLSDVPGIWYEQDGRAVQTAAAEQVNLDVSPFPPYELVEIDDYLMYRVVGSTLTLETSRGCPYRCKFCYWADIQGWRGMEPARVVEHLRMLVDRFGVKSYLFLDENFFVKFEWAREVLERIAREKMDIGLDLQGVRIDHVNRMDDDLLSLAMTAGCKKFSIGIDSGSPRLLEFIRKGLTIEEIIEGNRKLARYDIIPQYNFIVGFPTEEDEDIRQTVATVFQVLRENPRARISWINIFAPLPGTPLMDYEVERGLVPPDSLEGWVQFDRQTSRRTGVAKQRLERLYFASHFVDDKADYFVKSSFKRFLLRLYGPVARLRLRTLFFRLMPEEWLYKVFLRWYYRMPEPA